jgi:hypothetical protein
VGVAVLAAAVALLLARRADGPWGPLPGGPFRGVASPCPVSGWERFAGIRESDLETRPEAPRSVKTWNVVHEDRFYVPADFLTPGKRWPRDVVGDGRVRLRIEGDVFECRAVRVSDATTVEALRAAAARKYGIGEDDLAARTEVWWFRLEPR